MNPVKVVITGIGILCPVGNSTKESWARLVRGESGIAKFEYDEKTDVEIGGGLKSFDADAVLGKKLARRYARFTHIALAAAREAVADAGLLSAGYDAENIGAVLGVGMGGVEVYEAERDVVREKGAMRVSPFGLPAVIPNTAAGMVAIEFNAQGPCYCISSACASSAHAIGEAVEMIRRGAADAMITGGVESSLTGGSIASFSRMGALSLRNGEPTKASRPFDRDRDGFVMGEGGAVLVLEREERAKARGATIYAEVAGYGASADAFHITQPDEGGRGAVQSMRRALANARIAASDVGYLNAHGTSTQLNDAVETLAIHSVFQEHARRLWVSGTKSMTGHLLGGAGALETAICALVHRHGVVPPTINLDNPDPACDLDYVPHQARERRIQVSVTNSFGFGGQNASLVLRAV